MVMWLRSDMPVYMTFHNWNGQLHGNEEQVTAIARTLTMSSDHINDDQSETVPSSELRQLNLIGSWISQYDSEFRYVFRGDGTGIRAWIF